MKNQKYIIGEVRENDDNTRYLLDHPNNYFGYGFDALSSKQLRVFDKKDEANETLKNLQIKHYNKGLKLYPF